MRRIAQATGWVLLFAIAAISLGPPELRPDTGFPHDLEHAAIWFLAGLSFGLSYPNNFIAWLLGLCAFTLAIEIMQLWIPGRHARVLYFVVDIVAVAAGLLIGVTFDRFRRRA